MGIFDIILVLDILVFTGFMVFSFNEAAHDIRMGLTVPETVTGVFINLFFAAWAVFIASIVCFAALVFILY